MNDLTPGFERETGQVTLEGLPCGAAGEAFLAASGLELAFDRVDGRLCRAVVRTADAGRSIVGEQAAAILIRLFGPEAPGAVLGAATARGERPPAAGALSADPGLAGALSSLARMYAVRDTSPVSAGSPWWAEEAAELAERAGLPASAAQSWPRLTIPPPLPVLDVAAEVEKLEQYRVRRAVPQWMVDHGLVPEGLFQLGLSPYSDLTVRHEGRRGRIVVTAPLAPGADCEALSRCWVRLVDPDPEVRRILAQASFTAAGSRARADLQPPFPLGELRESWIEVVRDKLRPVRSIKGHRVRRALRWADAALRAERAPAGLDPGAARASWTALAAAAWRRCQLDWAAAGDADRAYLAARRLDAYASPSPVLRAPSETAAAIARQRPLAGPACLAEAMGSRAVDGSRG